MRIVCQQSILMKYHALFVIFEKSANWNCRPLQIIGGALWVKVYSWQPGKNGFSGHNNI